MILEINCITTHKTYNVYYKSNVHTNLFILKMFTAFKHSEYNSSHTCKLYNTTQIMVHGMYAVRYTIPHTVHGMHAVSHTIPDTVHGMHVVRHAIPHMVHGMHAVSYTIPHTVHGMHVVSFKIPHIVYGMYAVSYTTIQHRTRFMACIF